MIKTKKEGITKEDIVRVKERVKEENVAAEESNLDAEAMQAVAENQESPEEAFKRVSIGRINKIGKYLNLLGNMAGQPNYNYTQQDLKEMFGYLEEALARCKMAYEDKGVQEFQWK